MAYYFIKCVQAAILLGLPIVLGWVVLRRIFSENKLHILIPGAILFGMMLVMGMLNEIRFFLNMKSSVHLLYFLVIASILSIIFLQPAKKQTIRMPLQWKKIWSLSILIGSTLFLCLYFGIPSSRGILNDAWWGHYPFAIDSRIKSLFPLNPAFSPWELLYYHYGPDLLAALWSWVFNLSTLHGFTLNLVLFTFITFLLVYAIAYHRGIGHINAVVAGFLVLAGGNLRFLLIPYLSLLNSGSVLSALNSTSIEGLLEMAFTPSHIMGVPALFLGMYLFHRHQTKPHRQTAVFTGIFLGLVSMIAEWYYGILFLAAAATGLSRRKRGFGCGFILPAAISLAIALTNNSYLSGYMTCFRQKEITVENRLEIAEFIARAKLNKADLSKLENINNSIKAMRTKYMPDLIPLRLNFSRFGKLPSWDAGGSVESEYIPIFSRIIFIESFPILIIGIIFAFFSLFRRKDIFNQGMITVLAVSVSAPIFLDWGYRSADLLRFFVPALACASFFFAVFLRRLWSMKKCYAKPATMLLLLSSIANAFFLGIVGLSPETFSLVHEVSSSAVSLRSAVSGKNDLSDPVRANSASFEYLAKKTGEFINIHPAPRTSGRPHAVFLIPENLLPPQDTFQEWMKIGTYSEVMFPFGRHWGSAYAEIYRQIIKTMDPFFLNLLEIEWVIESSFYPSIITESVKKKFENPALFEFALRLDYKQHWFKIYRVIQ